MKPLILNNTAKEKLKALREHAEENPVTLEYLMKMVNKQCKPIGDVKGHFCNLDVGYKVVLSIELQEVGKVRHMSMSVYEKNSLPPVEAAKEVMKLLGFQNELRKCKSGLEELGDGYTAVNIAELIK